LQRDYLNIDTKKSILRRKLYFKDRPINIFDVGTIVVFFSFIAGAAIFLMYRDMESNGSPNYAYFILELICAIICLFIVYRKLTEKRLFSIKTNLSKDQTKQIVDNYFQPLKLKSWNNIDMLCYTDNSTILGVYYYFVLPLDNEILLTVIKDQERLPLPAIITLWTTRSDLKKFIRKHE
jgi:hypothetical protein